MKTIVIGHKNPDMDAICSALAYAEFKRATGMPDVFAGRCGNINERIDYGLRRFGFEPPAFFSDVQPRIEDIMERHVVAVHAKAPFYETVTHIGERKFRGIPVLDDSGRCLGLISSYKISRYFFPPRETLATAREVETSLADICRTIDGNSLAGSLDEDIVNHILVVAAMQTDTFQNRLEKMDPARTVLIVGDRTNIQRLAIEAGVRALIITGGFHPLEETVSAAKQNNIALISSPHDTATTVLLARSAVNSEHMLDPNFTAFSQETPLEEARRDIALSPDFVFPVVAENGRMNGIFSKSDLLKPIPRQLILVDHNELSQAVNGADVIPIVEILDHHRIGAAHTQQPILFLNRPVGSTCTIVAGCYQQAGIAIPKRVAGILMCGLISDTLNLTSPTTTAVDHAVMAELAEITGLNSTDLASEIFSVGSPLLTMTPDQAVSADCKEYTERGQRFCVAQIEELSFSQFEEKKSALLEALESYRSIHRYLFSALLVTDVNTQNSYLLVRGTEAFVRLIDFPEAGPHCWRLDGVVSRKKQLLPYLTGILARAV